MNEQIVSYKKVCEYTPAMQQRVWWMIKDRKKKTGQLTTLCLIHSCFFNQPNRTWNSHTFFCTNSTFLGLQREFFDHVFPKKIRPRHISFSLSTEASRWMYLSFAAKMCWSKTLHHRSLTFSPLKNGGRGRRSFPIGFRELFRGDVVKLRGYIAPNVPWSKLA